MTKNAYSIKDIKAGFFNPPFYSHNDAEATRAFKTTANNPSTSIHMYPGDYDLYRVGSFDDQTGELIACKPDHVCNAVAVKDVLSAVQ